MGFGKKFKVFLAAIILYAHTHQHEYCLGVTMGRCLLADVFCVEVHGTWMWRLHVNVKCLSQFLSTVHFMAGFLKNLELTDWLASKRREFSGLRWSEVGITGACHSAFFALIFFLMRVSGIWTQVLELALCQGKLSWVCEDVFHLKFSTLLS